MIAYIFFNNQKDPDYTHIKAVIEALEKAEIHCLMDLRFEKILQFKSVTFLNEKTAIAKCDVVLTIGGDGTILHVASLLFGTDKPLLGINLGRIGFLATLELHELHMLPRLKTGDYFIEKRALLDVYVNDKKVDTALNELLVSQGMLATTIGLELYCDDVLVNHYRSDGILIATSTGSTAYSLSAGGPILDTRVDASVVTPICAHSLYSPSIVFAADRVLCVRIVPDDRIDEYVLTVDGRSKVKLKTTDLVFAKSSQDHINLISFAETQQFASVDTKLKWR